MRKGQEQEEKGGEKEGRGPRGARGRSGEEEEEVEAGEAVDSSGRLVRVIANREGYLKAPGKEQIY